MPEKSGRKSVGALSQRKRDFVRAQTSAAVLPLVIERGFENVTADQMAEAAGLTRRTFFRYFESKEDALFVAIEGSGQLIAEQLEARPSDQPIWDAIRDAMLAAVAASSESDGSKRLVKLLYESPALRSRPLDKQERWRTILSDRILQRLKGPHARHHAALLSALAMAALDAALVEWVHTKKQPLRALISESFARAKPAIATS